MSDRYQELVSGLDSPLEAERVKAIERLVRSNDVRAIRALQGVVSRDASVRVRYLAKKALFLFKERMKGALPEKATNSLDTMPQQIDLKKIEKILGDGDVQKKLKLLQAIAKFRLKEAIPVIIRHGKSETDAVVRSNLVLALGILGNEDQLDDVKLYLNDKDFRVRANAIEAIESIDHPKGYPVLVNLLADSDNRIRANAIKALKHFGKVNVANLLRRMMHSDEVWMRDSAAYALSVMAKDDALPLLLEAARDEELSVREKAVKGIKKLADKGNALAVRLLAELDRAGKQDGTSGIISFDLIEEELLAPQKTPDFLEDPDPQIRLKAIREIVTEKDSTRIFDLVNCLASEEDDFVKANMINALGAIGDENLVDSLKEFLTSPVDRIRANAVEAVSRLGGSKAHPILIPLLADQNNRCRANAVVALKDYPYVDVLKPLLEMVESTELLMRKSAFYAITDIGTPETVPLLQKLLKDEDDDLRVNVLHFLKMMRAGGDTASAHAISRQETGIGSETPEVILTNEFFPEVPEETMKVPSVADKYDITNFPSLSKDEKRAIVGELGKDVTVGSYYFLREVLHDNDFEIKVLAKMALKNFDEFASQEAEKKLDASSAARGKLLNPPEIETVEYHGMSKAIRLSRELNDRADQFEYSKAWKGPFPAEVALFNALRSDTREMLQEILQDDQIEMGTVCFHQSRLKPFLEGRRTLDGNRFANVVTLAGTINRIDAFGPSHVFLKAIKRPVYLLVILTDKRVILFLRGPLETSFARYIQIYYSQIDDVLTQKFHELVTISLKVGNQFFEIPELYSYVATSLVEAIRSKSMKVPPS